MAKDKPINEILKATVWRMIEQDQYSITDVAIAFETSQATIQTVYDAAKADKLKEEQNTKAAEYIKSKAYQKTLGKRRVQIIVTCPMCEGTAFVEHEYEYRCTNCGHSIGDDPEVYPWKVYQI